jgi:hypothetical protein
VLGFNFMGDALRDRLDPRRRLELGLKMTLEEASKQRPMRARSARKAAYFRGPLFTIQIMG